MTNVRPAAISAFAVAFMSALTALAQLNPTVNVLPRPQAPVPGECEEGLAPAQPRTFVAETPARPAPAPAPTAAPPTLDLKTRLRAVESAAQQGDRDAFKQALAAAHSAVAGYPRGGERDAANEVLRVYDDLEQLWDYAFTSPSGAFFDATTENGALLKMLQRYPDYSRTIADSTLNVGGTVVYPAAESRKFLVAEASRRLAQLGVRMPERIAEVPRPAPPAPAPVAAAPAPPHVSKQAIRKEARVATVKPRQAVVHKPKAKIAEAHAAPRTTRRSEPAPRTAAQAQPQPAPQPPTETAAPPQATPVPAPAPAPVAPQPTNTATSMPPAMQTAPPPQSATTATTAPAPSTTAATTTTTNAAPPAQQSGGRVNLLFAIILIVVGIGVLIVLLRASD